MKKTITYYKEVSGYMKYLSAMACVLFLTGCFYQSVDQKGLTRAEELCKDKLGVFMVTSYFSGALQVTCRNSEILLVEVE